jgi:heat shock protein HslJ
MNTKNILIAAGFLLIALSGCIGTTEEKEIPLNSTWLLKSFGDTGSEEPVISGSKVTLQFVEEGKIAGSGGCNRYFSSYVIESGNKLSFGLIGSTMMYCEGVMDQEYQYLGVLENISAIEFDQTSLKLYYNDGRGVLNFELLEEEPKWKVETVSAECGMVEGSDLNISGVGNSIIITVSMGTSVPCFDATGDVTINGNKVLVEIDTKSRGGVCVECIGKIVGRVTIFDLPPGDYEVDVRAPDDSALTTIRIE